MGKVPEHLKGKQTSQIAKKKEAEKTKAELIAKKILEEEELENESSNDSSIESSKNSNDNSNNTPQIEVASSEDTKSSATDILANISPVKKEKKEKANLYLSKEDMDKLITLSVEKGMSMTALLEEILKQILVDVKIDENAVKKYKKKNKVKSSKSKKES